jgi:glutamine cyclotransferase
MTQTRKHPTLRYTVAVLALMTLAAAWLAAAPAVVGTWECVSTTPDDADLHWTLTVTESDGKLSATATGETGDSNLNDVTFDGKVLSFTATLDSGTYTVKVNVAGDKMEGTWSGAGDSGKVTGSRKKS